MNNIDETLILNVRRLSSGYCYDQFAKIHSLTDMLQFAPPRVVYMLLYMVQRPVYAVSYLIGTLMMTCYDAFRDYGGAAQPPSY